MPKGDRTGPTGMGPMTGRQNGFCAGYNAPGFVRSGFGNGRGMGSGNRGGGCGWRNRFYMTGVPGWMAFQQGAQAPIPQEAQMASESEKEALKKQSDALQSQLDGIQKRLREMGS